MQGQKGGRLLVLVQVVNIRDEGDLFQKGGQGLLCLDPRILLGDAAQLHDVAPAFLALLGPIAHHIGIAGTLQERI